MALKYVNDKTLGIVLKTHKINSSALKYVKNITPEFIKTI